MIGKLMKYELRSLLRKFLPLWGGLAALGLINGFTIRHVLENDRIQGMGNFLLGVLPLILLGILGTVLGVLTLVFICERFYQGLLGREGYLMLTLPVSSGEHILAKTLSSLLLMVLTALVFCVSGFLLLLSLDAETLFDAAKELLRLLREAEMPAGLGWLCTEGALWALVSAVTATLHIYAALALGHLAARHRLGWAMLAYVGLNTLVSTGVYRLGALAARRGFDRFEFFLGPDGWHGSPAPLAGALGVVILMSLVLGVAFFFVTKLIMDHKLNLE